MGINIIDRPGRRMSNSMKQYSRVKCNHFRYGRLHEKELRILKIKIIQRLNAC